MTTLPKRINNPPYRCKYCGCPSWIEPVDQTPPPDYCHESDHGETPEEDGVHDKIRSDFVRVYGSDEGWFDIQGSYFIAGWQARDETINCTTD